MTALLCAAAVTVLAEGAVFAAAGWRKPWELAVTACVNIITNVLLNAVLALGIVPYAWIVPFELGIVVVEFTIYMWAFERSWKLLGVTFAANAASFVAGLLLF